MDNMTLIYQNQDFDPKYKRLAEKVLDLHDRLYTLAERRGVKWEQHFGKLSHALLAHEAETGEAGALIEELKSVLPLVQKYGEEIRDHSEAGDDAPAIHRKSLLRLRALAEVTIQAQAIIKEAGDKLDDQGNVKQFITKIDERLRVLHDFGVIE